MRDFSADEFIGSLMSKFMKKMAARLTGCAQEAPKYIANCGLQMPVH
jgi:hypothetical protein